MLGFRGEERIGKARVRATPDVLNLSFMTVTISSFSKINLGLRIGRLRPDGFHELRSVYQTIALHDRIRISVDRGSGIEIRCDDPRVPCDARNTCYQIVERAMATLKAPGRVVVEVEKRLPVQGGLGGASGNAVATLLALERALRKSLDPRERLRIAAEVGSDLPLFLIGGTVLGVGRGEETYPLPDLPAMPCVIALPEVAISTPRAFSDWDRLSESKLTAPTQSDRIWEFSREISAWLNAAPGIASGRRSGVSARSGGRAESPPLDLVRTGIENDFEQVVFPQYPELPKVKRVLERAGATYASLSGSGSAVYGLFRLRTKAAVAAKMLNEGGTLAVVTSILTRRQYWKKLQVSD
jgi:4-diphosphocytidyl-2-C-methyl-D-erythritol kinase